MTPTSIMILPAFGRIEFDRVMLTFADIPGALTDSAGLPVAMLAEVLAPIGKGEEWARKTFPNVEVSVAEVHVHGSAPN